MRHCMVMGYLESLIFNSLGMVGNINYRNRRKLWLAEVSPFPTICLEASLSGSLKPRIVY